MECFISTEQTVTFMEGSKMKILGPHHVAIQAGLDQLDEVAAFYKDILGFQPIETPEGFDHLRWFNLIPGQLDLHIIGSQQKPHFASDIYQDRRGCLTLVREDARDFAKELREQKVRTQYLTCEFYVRDPAGLSLIHI